VSWLRVKACGPDPDCSGVAADILRLTDRKPVDDTTDVVVVVLRSAAAVPLPLRYAPGTQLAPEITPAHQPFGSHGHVYVLAPGPRGQVDVIFHEMAPWRELVAGR